MKRLLLVQLKRDVPSRAVLAPAHNNFEIVKVTDREDALLFFTLAKPTIVVCDFHEEIEQRDFLLIERMREQDLRSPIIVFTHLPEVDWTIEVMEAGASLVVANAFHEEDVVELISKIVDGMEGAPASDESLHVRSLKGSRARSAPPLSMDDRAELPANELDDIVQT